MPPRWPLTQPAVALRTCAAVERAAAQMMKCGSIVTGQAKAMSVPVTRVPWRRISWSAVLRPSRRVGGTRAGACWGSHSAHRVCAARPVAAHPEQPYPQHTGDGHHHREIRQLEVRHNEYPRNATSSVQLLLQTSDQTCGIIRSGAFPRYALGLASMRSVWHEVLLTSRNGQVIIVWLRGRLPKPSQPPWCETTYER
jgi:hypothetical protein